MSQFDLVEIGGKLAMGYIPFVLSLTVHEYAHAIVAKWHGDNTAESLGRVSLNPAVHLDPIGTVLLPISNIVFGIPIPFGWAKPVPFNPRNLKDVKNGTFWISFAGPLANVIMAIVATILLGVAFRTGVPTGYEKAIYTMLAMFIRINLLLAVFNMLPIHPLDGGKVLARFLPPKINSFLEQNEQHTFWILMILAISGGLAVIAYPVNYMFEFLVRLVGG
jgi:Zn-dependent protease